MFGFLGMFNNLEDITIDKTKVGPASISTVDVTDRDYSHETVVSHPSYDHGNWVIVESYDDRDEAILGHKRWVDIFEAGESPSFLNDIFTGEIIKKRD